MAAAVAREAQDQEALAVVAARGLRALEAMQRQARAELLAQMVASLAAQLLGLQDKQTSAVAVVVALQQQPRVAPEVLPSWEVAAAVRGAALKQTTSLVKAAQAGSLRWRSLTQQRTCSLEAITV